MAVAVEAGLDRDDVAGDELAAAVNRTAQSAGIVLVELSPLRTSLEDRYLALVNGTASTTNTARTTATDTDHPALNGGSR